LSMATAKGDNVVTLDSIAKMAQRSSGNYLNLRRQRIDDRGIESVVQWCKEAGSTFTHIGLTDNDVGDEGVAHLTAAAADGSICVHGLFLSTNQIGCAGVRNLARQLSRETNEIVKLGLNFNEKIGCGGAQILAKAIPLSNLEVLGLTSCKVGDRGCIALAHALESGSCRMTRLFLNGNLIGDDGACAMAKFLTKSNSSSSLLRLGLAQCQYSNTGAAALRTALGANSSLERLCMFGNPEVDEEEYQKLRQTSRVNLESLHGNKSATESRAEGAEGAEGVEGAGIDTEEVRMAINAGVSLAPSVVTTTVVVPAGGCGIGVDSGVERSSGDRVEDSFNMTSTSSLVLLLHRKNCGLQLSVVGSLSAHSVASVASLSRSFRRHFGTRSLVWRVLLQRDFWSARCEPLCTHAEHHWRTLYQHAATGATTSASQIERNGRGGSMKGRKIFVCEVCAAGAGGGEQRFGLLKKLHNHLRRVHNIVYEDADTDVLIGAVGAGGGGECSISGMGAEMVQERPQHERRADLDRMRHRYAAVDPSPPAHMQDTTGYVYLLYPPPSPLPYPSFGCCCGGVKCGVGDDESAGGEGGSSCGVGMVGRRLFLQARGKHGKQGSQQAGHALVVGVKQTTVRMADGEDAVQELVEVQYVGAADAATVVCAHPPHLSLEPPSSIRITAPLRLQLVALQPGPCVIVTAVTRHYRDLCYSQCESGDSVVEIGSSYGLSTRILAHQAFGLYSADLKTRERTGRVVALEVSKPLLVECRDGSMACWKHYKPSSPSPVNVSGDGSKDGSKYGSKANTSGNTQGHWIEGWHEDVEWELLDAVDTQEPARAQLLQALEGPAGIDIDKVFIDIGGNRAIEDGLLSLIQFVQAKFQPKLIVVKNSALAISACGQFHKQRGSNCEPTHAVPQCAKWLDSLSA
jgi:hypothetical protein